MKTIALFFALTLASVASAQIARPIFIRGEQALKMMSHSVWTGEKLRPAQSASQLGVNSSFEVYSFDANWKCYFMVPEDNASRMAYCSYFPNQNADGLTANPQSLLVKITDRRSVDALIEQSDLLGEVQLPFDHNFSENVPVAYMRYGNRNWQCFRIQNSDANQPGVFQLVGLPRPPDEFCEYSSPRQKTRDSGEVKMVEADATH
jgi:hypothetical protein